MPKTIRKQPNFLAIGIFMAVGIMSILISVVFADKLINRLKGGYSIYVRFNELDGLVPGSKISVGSGKHIGQVESIELDGAILVVEAFIENKYKINQGASFEIFSSSFVGGKYVAVVDYTGSAPFLEKNSTVEGKDPISINSILGMFGEAMDSGSDGGLMVGITGIVGSLNETATLANNIIKDNRTNINTTLDNVASASIHVNKTLANVERKLATVSDKEFAVMLKDVQGSLQNLDLFLKDINSKNAPLSLLKDPNMTHSLRTIITNLEETTERVKAKPSLLLRS